MTIKNSLSKNILSLGLVFALVANCCFMPLEANAQQFALPPPGQMLALSATFNPVVIKGIQLDYHNPFRFHFFVDRGDALLHGQDLKAASSKLIKYFLASLTIPEEDLWVNLSPYEQGRIIPNEFGLTAMGRDLLAQDYVLKQLTASLIYPEGHMGKEFWQDIYAKAKAEYGTTNIPINTFNKVWIVPEKAVVYENKGTAFVLENHLKVMLEEDFLSMHKHIDKKVTVTFLKKGDSHFFASQIIRELVIPVLNKEVNEGKNFAPLRQAFYSLILATWYKKKIKNGILNKIYSDRKKINNLLSTKTSNPSDIYQAYLKAFKKGVFNYIKEIHDPITNQDIPRKYFSGGVEAGRIVLATQYIGPSNAQSFHMAKMVQTGRLVEEEVDMAMQGDAVFTLDQSKAYSDIRNLTKNDNVESLVIINTSSIWGTSIIKLDSLIASILLRWPHIKEIDVVSHFPEIEAMDKRIKVFSPQDKESLPLNKTYDAMINFNGLSAVMEEIEFCNDFKSENGRKIFINHFDGFLYTPLGQEGIIRDLVRQRLVSLGFPPIDSSKPLLNLELNGFKKKPPQILINIPAITHGIHPDEEKKFQAWAEFIAQLINKNYEVVLNGGKKNDYLSLFTVFHVIKELPSDVKKPEIKQFSDTNEFVRYMAQQITAVVTLDTGTFHAAWELLRLPTVVITNPESHEWIQQPEARLQHVSESNFIENPSAILEPLEKVIQADQRDRAMADQKIMDYLNNLIRTDGIMRISQLAEDGERLFGLSKDSFFALIRHISEQKLLKTDPRRWTSLIPTFHIDGTPTGNVESYWGSQREGEWRKAAGIFIFSSDGKKLFLQMRPVSVNRKPTSMLDVSAAGAVDIGLDGKETAIKEAQEELDLNLSIGQLHQIVNAEQPQGIFHLNFTQQGPDTFDNNGVFHAKSDHEIRREIFEIFSLQLTPQQEQEWRVAHEHSILTWEKFKQKEKAQRMNDEVSGIVEVDVDKFFEEVLPYLKTEKILARGLKAALAFKSVQKRISSPDRSMNTKGGIDLNPIQMDMQIQGHETQFDFSHIPVNINGVVDVTFTIGQIDPVNNLFEVLGLNKKPSRQQLAGVF